jgi:hypothetical protein
MVAGPMLAERAYLAELARLRDGYPKESDAASASKMSRT